MIRVFKDYLVGVTYVAPITPEVSWKLQKGVFSTDRSALLSAPAIIYEPTYPKLFPFVMQQFPLSQSGDRRRPARPHAFLHLAPDRSTNPPNSARPDCAQ